MIIFLIFVLESFLGFLVPFEVFVVLKKYGRKEHSCFLLFPGFGQQALTLRSALGPGSVASVPHTWSTVSVQVGSSLPGPDGCHGDPGS